MYIPMLQSNHPLFQDKKQKFTNTSLQKYHNDALSEAGAPIIVQQESLAQNTRAYAKKATDGANKQKVAQIVAGERKTWHSPPISSIASQNFKPQVSLPIKKRKVLQNLDENTNENQVHFSTTINSFKVHFTNGHSAFHFEGTL